MVLEYLNIIQYLIGIVVFTHFFWLAKAYIPEFKEIKWKWYGYFVLVIFVCFFTSFFNLTEKTDTNNTVAIMAIPTTSNSTVNEYLKSKEKEKEATDANIITLKEKIELEQAKSEKLKQEIINEMTGK